MSEAVFSLSGVAKAYQQAKARLEVLRGVDLDIRAGELVALVGPSGAGKSTLLHVAGLLDRPDSGRVTINGLACAELDDEGRTAVRRRHIGFVYQYHHLLPEFSALENVVIPQRIAGTAAGPARERAEELLDRLGLSGRLTHRPAQLSGGEQQRVALARAVANRPRVLLADEPTGNLDPNTAGEVFALLLDLARTDGMAAIVATHNPVLAARLDRTVRLDRGVLVEA